jgi:hypothetical protein
MHIAAYTMNRRILYLPKNFFAPAHLDGRARTAPSD